MATPNYSFQKRQRELAKKRKNEEKRQRKAAQVDGAPAPDKSTTQDDATLPKPDQADPST